MENFNVLANCSLQERPDLLENKDVQALQERVERYTRLCFMITFLGAQKKEDLSDVFDTGLITKEEEAYLKMLSVGTRGLAVVGWINKLVKEIIDLTQYKYWTYQPADKSKPRKLLRVQVRPDSHVNADLMSLQVYCGKARGGMNKSQFDPDPTNRPLHIVSTE